MQSSSVRGMECDKVVIETKSVATQNKICPADKGRGGAKGRDNTKIKNECSRMSVLPLVTIHMHRLQ